MDVRPKQHRFPFCIVWTPIPLLTWIFPFIGHMGIATSKGIIRDFAGSYHVAENNMGFGWPTLYRQLSPEHVEGGAESWDLAVMEASEEYNTRMHNLLCDNCHSHVALALNRMRYKGRTDWNMFKLAFTVNFGGKFVGFGGFMKQYLPFTLILLTIVSFIFIFQSR